MLQNPDRNLPSLKAMVSNVYQFNRQEERLIEMVKDHQPDVLLLVETDQWWVETKSIRKWMRRKRIVRRRRSRWKKME